MAIKSLAHNFIKVKIGDGKSTLFWFDNWTSHGPLIEFVGELGPRLLRLNRYATVADAVSAGNWSLPPARSDNIQELLISLAEVRPPSAEAGDDTLLWKHEAHDFKRFFSSAKTWKQIRQSKPRVEWHSLTMQQRLPTRDRLRRWGLQTDDKCVLCGVEEESHHHLFFECSYSVNLWLYFASCCWSSPPDNLYDCHSWITQAGNDRGKNREILSKLILQVTVHLLWNERNNRIFRNIMKPIDILRRRLDKTMRNLLLSMKERRATDNNFLVEH
ncbi:PREDICTED: uncharacterized protein LOC104825191 [Tarenaya hassleriana]|uniref:uncharacterized protein LOC104825191 n=1 Tax=Tarenaya hassleriana TaxID=28532 RepID=UPI00053C5135|nr:PREDICTED: uncharacterized protein LOC104825191 [Tarenaya hassleriana]